MRTRTLATTLPILSLLLLPGCHKAAPVTGTAAVEETGSGASPGEAVAGRDDVGHKEAAPQPAAKDGWHDGMLGGAPPSAGPASRVTSQPARQAPPAASAVTALTTPAAPISGGLATDGEKGASGAGAGGVALDPSRPSTPPPPPAATATAAPSVASLERGHDDETSRWRREFIPQQNATIKAGEWDDNANYRDFQRYIANEETLPIHRVDVSDRHFLVVRDIDGKAVPRCRVTVSDTRQHQTTLTTNASGRALLFPHAEQLEGGAFVASAVCEGSSTTGHFNLADQDGVVDLRLQTKRTLPSTRPVDVAFVLDTTGSMSEEITAVKATIQKVAQSLGGSNFRVRIGMVEYKDRGDPFVTRVHDFSSDAQKFASSVANISASGGGDTPESVNEGLHVGLTRLEWSRDAVAKFAFLIGDAPPHLDYSNDFDYAADMRDASHRGIQVFTIAASGMDALGQAVWRQIAQYTDATNLFVLRGGAGPQSTGAGDPKSSCGGTQTQYESGNLDALILAKITHGLKALDSDPMRIAGLRVDENAKPCNERVLAFD